jgi:hypothetical protein
MSVFLRGMAIAFRNGGGLMVAMSRLYLLVLLLLTMFQLNASHAEFRPNGNVMQLAQFER